MLSFLKILLSLNLLWGILYIGLFQKKNQMGVRLGCWEHTFLKKPLEFFIFYFTAGISRQNKASSMEIPHIFVRSFGNSKNKQKARPLDGDSIIFSWSPLEIPLHFWLPPLEIPHAISLTPLEIPYPQPPCLVFFLE